MQPSAAPPTHLAVALSISPEAASFIRAQGASAHLEPTAIITTACCAQSFQDRPAVRLGDPPGGADGIYVVHSLDDVTVFVPTEIGPQRRPLRIVLASFLGWKGLRLEGWSPL